MTEYSTRPSKQFLIRGSIALGIVGMILIVQTSWFRQLIGKKELAVTITDPLTVEDLITEDSNANGIPNWEEKLWGLDPTVLYTNGVPNKEIIEQKRGLLKYHQKKALHSMKPIHWHDNSIVSPQHSDNQMN